LSARGIDDIPGDAAEQYIESLFKGEQLPDGSLAKALLARQIAESKQPGGKAADLVDDKTLPAFGLKELDNITAEDFDEFSYEKWDILAGIALSLMCDYWRRRHGDAVVPPICGQAAATDFFTEELNAGPYLDNNAAYWLQGLLLLKETRVTINSRWS